MSERPLSTIGLVGGAHDGERIEIPSACPCCGKPLAEVGAVYTTADGERYIVTPDLDVEHAYSVDAARAILESET